MSLVHETWRPLLAVQEAEPYWSELRVRVLADRASGAVYPPKRLTFAALRVPLPSVQVVVLGQDPYHGEGQACGLAFSVPPGVAPPPSLRTVLQEVMECAVNDARHWIVRQPAHAIDAESLRPVPTDCCGAPADHAASGVRGVWDGRSGDLSPWVDRGVLLLNAVLTVRAGQPRSHAGVGWENFTAAVLRAVAREPRPIAWLLWGADARRTAERALKCERLLPKAGEAETGVPHLILTAPHPSPLATRAGAVFSGCGHFSRVNSWRAKLGLPPMDWSVGR